MVLLGADRVEIARVRVEGGEIVVWVHTPDARMVLWGACGARARSKGRWEVRLRDAPGPGGAGCEVRWRKRIWWCPRVGCEVRAWIEECGLAGPRRVLARRAAQWAVGRLAAVEGTVASAARRLGVAWAAVWSSVADDPKRVGPAARPGLDETVTGSAGRLRRRRYVSAAVDAAAGQVLDVFDGRDAADVGRRLASEPPERLAGIEVVCCDPHEGYRSRITRARRDTHLSDSVKIAADAFGIVRLANQALDGARRRVHNETTGHRGRKRDPLYHARKLLLTGAERLDAAGWDKMLAALDAADPADEIRECWVAKEHVRDIFRAHDPHDAAPHLDEAIDRCEHPSAPPELATLARTLRRRHTEIATAVRTRTSNARTEAANTRTNHAKRSARGFPNLADNRPRILLAAGPKARQTQPVTQIRTRRPSLVA
ncbi:ISL3 family transposase [Candidatus Poriferisodalis sp.]|uniref:ISL3 family transposase n=1 Tax=Candidatus Poriferisodalis sp. TaxID=3101277 RepID=UPI003D0A35F0